MPNTGTAVDLAKYFEEYRERHGTEAWQTEIRRLAKVAIRTSPEHESFWKTFCEGFDWLDWESLKQESLADKPPTDQEQLMADMLRSQMPGIKTQAQYNAVLGALDAVRLILNAILIGSVSQALKGREALEMAFDLTAKATEVSKKLEEVPEAATSNMAAEFKNPPAQFHEYDHQRQLLTELETIADVDGLNAWYASTKDRRDKIVTQGLRNILMDSIRAKKASLT